MKAEVLNRVKVIRQAIKNRFRKGLSTRDAIGISIIVHIVIGSALASFLIGTMIVQPADLSQTIEFDLTTEEVSSVKADQLNGQNSDQFGVSNSEASKQVGRASTLTKGNMNRETTVMASLASLSELKESFNFIMAQVTADSVGGFSPAEGKVPGSEYNSFGLKNGDGFGAGHGAGIYIGGGLCAPSAAPNPGR
ncbi:MAG: hypothetical protein ACE5HS_14100 [bacterium]